MALVTFLHPMAAKQRRSALARSISEAVEDGLKLLPAPRLAPEDDIAKIVETGRVTTKPMLWIVVARGNRLVGVLSPFELM